MKLKKSITFIYMDSAEKAMFSPLFEEAKKRGYQVKMTKNKFEKCEIGFYCQHTNFPQYSKFSVIMLHDIIQKYSMWPDIWVQEPWNKYDIGILPSNQWEENWNQASQWFYARPKRGMYKVGWPKADSVATIQKQSYKETFFAEYKMDLNKRTVLYAPSWENDRKQDDFVKAMLPLGVNILIKQADADPKVYPQLAKDIKEMQELHKDTEGVTILPPSTNIFNAIAVSDILVSEESSTMAEATMMGVPAVSVSDWLIPDVVPSRYPECNYDFVTMTKKDELQQCVAQILENYDEVQKQTMIASNNNFSNVGQTSTMILDIIDDYVAGRQVRYDSLKAKKNQRVPLSVMLKHTKTCFLREIYENYRIRYKFVGQLWNLLSKIKRAIIKREDT